MDKLTVAIIGLGAVMTTCVLSAGMVMTANRLGEASRRINALEVKVADLAIDKAAFASISKITLENRAALRRLRPSAAGESAKYRPLGVVGSGPLGPL